MSEYIIKCRDLYFQKITPLSIKDKKYEELLSVVNKMINEDGISSFVMFLQEDHYFIDLWTAHILLRSYITKIDLDIQSECIQIIIEHSNSPFSNIISKEETEWLKLNGY